MPARPDILDYLRTRRSVGMAFLKEPGPSAAELEQILTVGTRVPDHGKLTPWRLVVIAGEARAQVGEKLAEIAQRRHPEYNEASLDVERKRFLPAPVTIMVISKAGHDPKVPEWEQFLSAGNVAFNLQHAAFAMGYAAVWNSRWYSMDSEAGAMLGARYGERIVAFVSIGTPTAVIEDRPRPLLGDVVTYWQG
ncbi:MAG TPA: nitroreductase [Devosiaceae bacterium]|nr:nitroreductase [Devosiaceae bacterium]